ncbi:MAG: hypothetical protein PHP97_00160 [Candidatus Shapirobacteria bacterium]|nr:hypothetical protein [Candidatus Shapirobacteria bacterium]MDD3002941.1 hypothetical protein [Candidatus Shapirobacteria bacterium]MDD4383373.1 hypothetical protein [Candidatus Shapirobacteria bacterium]
MNYITFFRQFKIGPFATFDFVTAYLLVFLLSPFLTKLFSIFHLNISRSAWLWLTLPISVIFHLIFNQKTPLMKMLLDPKHFQFYLVIAILLFMIYMGLKNIRIKF